MDVLRQRLTENMQETNDVSVLVNHDQGEAEDPDSFSKNNYARPGNSQNLCVPGFASVLNFP